MDKCLYNESGTCVLDKDNAMCCLCGPVKKTCGHYVSLSFVRDWLNSVVTAVRSVLPPYNSLFGRSDQNK